MEVKLANGVVTIAPKRDMEEFDANLKKWRGTGRKRLRGLGFSSGDALIEAASSFLASRTWLSYLKAGGKRSWVLPDFLVAAYASLQAHRLLTRDRGFFKAHFPKLKIVDLSKAHLWRATSLGSPP